MIKETDPLYPHLAHILTACPLQAGPLYTAFKDLALSQEWHDLRALELPGTGWAVIIGHKRPRDPLRAVLPLPLHTSELKPSSLRSIFSSLSDLSPKEMGEGLSPLVPTLDELQRELEERKRERHPEPPLLTPPAPAATSSVLYEESRGQNGEEDGEVCETMDTDMIYIAIATTDSTVVYYKLSKGIKKPADIPDE